MARIRSVKPEFWSSPGTARCSFAARLLFIAMWNWADDYGYGTANPKELMAFAFPNDENMTAADFPTLRKELQTGYEVVFYEVDGRPYFHIPTWNKHQRTERKAKPQYPTPEQADTPSDLHKHPDDAASAGTSLQSVGTSGAGTGEQGNRGTGEQGEEPSSATLRAADDEPDPDDEPARPDVEAICTHLADQIEANGSKRPTITTRWRTSARLLLDVDGRTTDQVLRAIDWCQADEFWRANILSMPKLRLKYDQLRLAAQRTSRPGARDRNTEILRSGWDWAVQAEAAAAATPAIGAP